MEYKVVSFEDVDDKVAEALNAHDADGWQVLSACAVPMPFRFVCILRRTKKQKSKSERN